MIKVSALKKYGIELVEGDVISTKGDPSARMVLTGDQAMVFNNCCEIICDISNIDNVIFFSWRETPRPYPESCVYDIEFDSDNNWKPCIDWLMEQEDKNKQEDDMIELKEISNLDQDIASIKERELHKSPIIPFEPLTKTLTKKDYLISKAADSLTHTQYMQFMAIVDVLIEKEIIK